MTQAITKMEETPSRPITPSSLVVQISALRSQRNIKTRGLTQAAHDPEVEKMAKIAVILQAICADIEGVKGKRAENEILMPKAYIVIPTQLKIHPGVLNCQNWFGQNVKSERLRIRSASWI